jgi:hypothetical protein
MVKGPGRISCACKICDGGDAHEKYAMRGHQTGRQFNILALLVHLFDETRWDFIF